MEEERQKERHSMEDKERRDRDGEIDSGRVTKRERQRG
jgi:hypothetical protein